MPPSSDVIRRVNDYLGSREADIIRFLREIVAIPSDDSRLADVGRAVGDRMRSLGFDEVRFDSMGNILGRIGAGPRTLLYDSHLDTVGVSDRAAWQWDPLEGKVENGILYALGAGDEKGSTPPMIYALHALKHLGLLDGWTCYYFGNMEEWCDGIAGHALVEHERLRPEFVVIGEPTRMQVYRGHRGRVEVSVTFHGATAHASAPDRGVNAIYKAAAFAQRVAELNRTFKGDAFLGPGRARNSAITCSLVSPTVTRRSRYREQTSGTAFSEGERLWICVTAIVPGPRKASPLKVLLSSATRCAKAAAL